METKEVNGGGFQWDTRRGLPLEDLPGSPTPLFVTNLIWLDFTETEDVAGIGKQGQQLEGWGPLLAFRIAFPL